MEYLQGGELFSHLRKAEKFDEELAKFYASEIASALGVMNSLFIVYRDLKPENVMIGKHNIMIS
jgi:protein kinase A